jgi:hypothetical protein
MLITLSHTHTHIHAHTHHREVKIPEEGIVITEKEFQEVHLPAVVPKIPADETLVAITGVYV